MKLYLSWILDELEMQSRFPLLKKEGMPSSLNATTKRGAGSKNCKTTSYVDCFHGLPAVEHDLRRNEDTRAGVSTVYYIHAYCA